MSSLKENVWRNHITIVARKMTVNARCRKSLVFSYSSSIVVFMPGIL